MVLLDLTYWCENKFYVNPCIECTNDCLFCVRNFQDGVYGFELAGERNPSAHEIREAIEDTWDERFTDAAIVGFGEPLLNLDTSLEAIVTLEELSDVPVRMDTNGQASLIHPSRNVAVELKNAGLEEIQISLNASSAKVYDLLCQSEFGLRAYDAVLQFARSCKDVMRVVLSVVDIPGVDIEACRQVADELQVDFRVRGFKGPSHIADSISEKLSKT